MFEAIDTHAITIRQRGQSPNWQRGQLATGTVPEWAVSDWAVGPVPMWSLIRKDISVASRVIGAMRTNATSAVRPLPVHANFRWSIRTTESRQGRGAFVRLSSSDAATLFPLYFAENAIFAVVFEGEK